MPAMCKICLSPYKDELMTSWNKKFPRKMLWEKYNPLMWQLDKRKKGITFKAFLQAVYRHQDHKDTGVVVVQTKHTGVKSTTMGIAKMMTELYARKLETLKPEDITTRDYIGVNKLILDEKKLKLGQNEQLLELAKLFGIPEVVNPLDVIKGEEDAESGPTENKGNKQISPQ